MKQIALLEYMIIFDPTSAWQHGSEFEKALADFFAAYDYDMQVVDVRGGSGKRVIYLTKLETISVPEPPPIVQSTKQMFNKFTQKRDFDGKFRKHNK